MKPERWKQVEQLFHAALERAPEERAAFLAAACPDDSDLRREVEELLSYDGEAENFIEENALAVAAQELEAEDLSTTKALGLTGQQIGSYKILAPLGKGGMGEVHLALDTRLGRKVAVKLLPAKFTTDTDRVRRFAQEARAVSALNHPNIITIYDIGEVSSTHYIVEEYVEGETLRQRMNAAPQQQIAPSEAIDIAVQIAAALSAAHEAGITHRDIKPENVMVRRDGIVKVLDFGLAKLTETQAAPVDSQASTVAKLSTEAGVVMGTPRYMSPEQARGEKVDARTDIFSLGVMLYEMVAGRPPFTSATTSEVIAAILRDEPPSLAKCAPDAPQELERIVSKALCKDREDRYQVVKDLLLDLKDLKQELESKARLARIQKPGVDSKGSGARSSEEKSDKSLVNAIKRHMRGVAVALATLVVGLAAAVYVIPLMRQRFQPNPPPLQRKLSRLTFDPGLQSEPTWSPDGRFIAYSSDRSGNFDLWVQPVGEGNPVQVTKSPAHDWQPDWSPDGNRIVFRSEREGGGLFVAPALGGNERKLSSFGYRPRWSPDGSEILFLTSLLQVFADQPKLYVVGLDGKPPRALQPEFLGEFVGSPQVGWHPDGQRVSLWGTHRQLGASFWTVPVTGGAPIKSEITKQVEQQLKEVSATFSDFRWAPSGQALYLEGTAQGVRNLWRVEVDRQTLTWVAGPERLTIGPGLDTDLALSPDGKRLAFATHAERTRIWSLPFNSVTGRARGSGQPVTTASVTTAGMDAWTPNLSRDGKKLVFRAQRGGKQEIWEKSLEDGRETLLAAADDFGRYGPVWSRDGTRLAYRRYRMVNPERAQYENSIVLMSASGGEEQVLTSAATLIDIASDWSANGEWIIASSDRRSPGRLAICLFPISAAPQAETQMRVVISHPEYNLYQGHFSPDERWINFITIKATEAGISTIYVVPSAGGEWRRITEGKYWDDKPRWAPDGKTIYFVSDRTGFFNVWGIRFDPTSGEPVGKAFRVTAFESPGQMMSPRLVQWIEFSLTADRLVLPITEVSGSIWILENVDR